MGGSRHSQRGWAASGDGLCPLHGASCRSYGPELPRDRGQHVPLLPGMRCLLGKRVGLTSMVNPSRPEAPDFQLKSDGSSLDGRSI